MRLTLFIFFTTAVFSSIYARHGSPVSCCLKTNTKTVKLTSIRTYWRQKKGLCPVAAIVFTLKNGKVLCSDPDSPWAKEAMRKVNEKEEQKRSVGSGQAPDAPQDGTEGLLTATVSPLTSRWPQVPASVSMPMGKRRADPQPKSQRRIKKRIKIIKKKRKGGNKGGK